jgi:predicted nucleic acid-binding Zn ribbon protein
MPLYVYRVIRPKSGTDRRDASAAAQEETFEVRQSIHDPALTKHPETGEPVERVICAPAIASSKMGNAALSSAGFTKYSRRSDGTYEREAGSGGPKHVDPQKFKGMLGE